MFGIKSKQQNCPTLKVGEFNYIQIYHFVFYLMHIITTYSKIKFPGSLLRRFLFMIKHEKQG